MKTIITSLLTLVISTAFSQLPETDIWLLDIQDSAGVTSFHNPVNVTNRKGYDNQPAFSPDGSYLLFSSQRDSSGQTDIFKHEISTKKLSQITKTSTSEYSPTFMEDGKSISVVMVEKDSAQRLWRFPLGGGEPVCIAESITKVGYHCWLSKNKLALFILTKPAFTLQVHDFETKKSEIIADSIGRCMRIQQDHLWYTSKAGYFSNVYTHSLKTKKDSLVGMIEGEDYCFYSHQIEVGGKVRDEVWSCSDNSILYGFMNSTSGAHEIADLSRFGITKPTRITISPDGKKLAVVSNK